MRTEDDHRSGWDKYDSEYGYVECSKESADVDEWPPEPKMEVMIDGFDIPAPIALAPAFVLIIIAILRQVLLW